MAIVDRSFAELTAGEFHDLVRLRVDVFVVEQACAYQELDGRDTEPATRHVWLNDELGVSAYLRVLGDGDTRRIGRAVSFLELNCIPVGTLPTSKTARYVSDPRVNSMGRSACCPNASSSCWLTSSR